MAERRPEYCWKQVPKPNTAATPCPQPLTAVPESRHQIRDALRSAGRCVTQPAMHRQSPHPALTLRETANTVVPGSWAQHWKANQHADDADIYPTPSPTSLAGCKKPAASTRSLQTPQQSFLPRSGFAACVPFALLLVRSCRKSITNRSTTTGALVTRIQSNSQRCFAYSHCFTDLHRLHFLRRVRASSSHLST